jgi:hypothetical protein
MATFAKLGGHLRLWDMAGQCWVTNCPTVKSLDVPAYLDIAGGRLTVFRHYTGTGNPQWQNNTPQAYLNAVITALQGRHPTYIEGPNESGLDGDGSVGPTTQAFAAWTTQYTQAAHAAGYQVAGFSFSTGTPSAAQWAYLRSQGWCGVDAIAMHCYWAGQGFTTDYALRFATLWQPGDPPILITECGRDCVDNLAGQCPSNCGNLCGWDGSLQGPISIQQYLGELQQYDRILQGYPYVLAAHVFTNGGCPDFCSFEIDTVGQALWGTQCAPPPPPPTGCTSDSQCAIGYHCVNGTCVCLSDTDCQNAFGPASRCIQGACVQSAGGCSGPADCTAFGPNYACIQGQCLPVVSSSGISPTLILAGLFAGLAIGGAIYYIVTQGGTTQVIGAAEVRTIGANEPVPPGWVVLG